MTGRDIPKKYRKLYNKAKNSTSRKAKIRAFCLECCSYSEKEVGLCTDSGCVFHKIRLNG
jgi:hypothetical protein